MALKQAVNAVIARLRGYAGNGTELRLRVKVDANGLAPTTRQRGGKVKNRGGFSDPSFLVKYSDYSHSSVRAGLDFHMVI